METAVQINANAVECYLRQSPPKYINFLFWYSKCSIKFFNFFFPPKENDLNIELVPAEARLLTCYFWAAFVYIIY